MAGLNLESVHERMAAALRRSGRTAEEVTLVAIGKTHPIDVLMEAYAAGHRDFGENRAAELNSKAAAMPDDIRWHFVGSLQRNKVRQVRPVVSLLHSMDRLKLGAAWLKGPGRAPPALLEVNLADEPQKGGVSPGEATDLAGRLISLGVDLHGVMAIPPQVANPEEARPYFRRLAGLRDDLSKAYPAVREISMGMTDDFEVAIEEGATLIRVGRAIFGPRIEQGNT